MTNEVAEFNKATKRILELASKIDNDFSQIVDVQYPLVDIANILRKKYLDPRFRNKYVGNMMFNGTVPYAKGFCALSAICIYNLYGGDEIWEPSAIKLGAWEHAPVVFLRDRMHNRAFDTTGDQFAPLIVPYDVGTPINKRIQDMKTPNKSMFIREIINELNR